MPTPLARELAAQVRTDEALTLLLRAFGLEE
jgi:hypothetical protein